ncbi:MAG: hypothetical protein AAFQ64_04900 [Pseudomonadota bacterium]
MASTSKITFIVILGIAMLGLTFLAMSGIDKLFLHPLYRQLGLSWLTPVGTFWYVLAALLFLPGRWTALPIRYQIRATADVLCRPSEVWDVISPRPRENYWGAVISHVTGVLNEPNRIDLHFEQGEFAQHSRPLQAVIDQVEPERYFALRYLNADEFSAGAADLAYSEYILDPTDAGTRVTLVETLSCLRLVMIPLLLFLNPCRDSLVSLKAICEGTEDRSWMKRTAARLDELDG